MVLQVIPSTTMIILLCVIKAIFSRHYDYEDARTMRRQHYGQRKKFDANKDSTEKFDSLDLKRDRNLFLGNIKNIRLPSDYDKQRPVQQQQNDPNYFRPLSLPVKEAIWYVRRYGRHVHSLRKLENQIRKLPRSLVMLKKRSLSQCKDRPKDKGCRRDVNGCGSGFTESIPLLYREEFTPCCNKHDVCYDCGMTRHWTREECDNQFYDDMGNTCSCLYPGWYQYPVYKTCKLWASTLYAVFSASYFGTQAKDFCKSECILPYGSPHISLLN